MNATEHPSLMHPLPVNRAARALQVPAKWLRDEVTAGRLPGVNAGGQILVHVPSVREVLTQRASRQRDDQASPFNNPITWFSTVLVGQRENNPAIIERSRLELLRLGYCVELTTASTPSTDDGQDGREDG